MRSGFQGSRREKRGLRPFALYHLEGQGERQDVLSFLGNLAGQGVSVVSWIQDLFFAP